MAKQQTPTTTNKLKNRSHKIFYKNAIDIFVALNHGHTAAQNTMQKMMALLNWLNFVSEVYFKEPARHKDSQRTLHALHPCANARIQQFKEVLAPNGARFCFRIVCCGFICYFRFLISVVR